jgi:hypothetical protein
VTEEEWLSGVSTGWMLEHVKRMQDLSPRIRGRKFRLAAAAIVRGQPGAESVRGVSDVVGAVERYCDGGVPFAEVSKVIREAGYPPPVDGRGRFASWDAILWNLASPDGFSSAYEVAANTRGDASNKVPIQVGTILDVFGNPFRPITFDPSWQTTNAVGLARSINESRDFAVMPVLADALEEAGCDSPDVLAHCRGETMHARGCWVVDLVLGKA